VRSVRARHDLRLTPKPDRSGLCRQMDRHLRGSRAGLRHAIACPIESIRCGCSPDAERSQAVCVIIHISGRSAVHRFCVTLPLLSYVKGGRVLTPGRIFAPAVPPQVPAGARYCGEGRSAAGTGDGEAGSTPDWRIRPPSSGDKATLLKIAAPCDDWGHDNSPLPRTLARRQDARRRIAINVARAAGADAPSSCVSR
jgi:hypothetical protein